jgi:hypothetical protein
LLQIHQHTTNGNKRMNNIRSTVQRVALALLLAVSLSGLALLGGGAPVSHAAPAATATAASVPGCVLTVRPSTSNLIIANPGTTMWILYHALPNAVITTTIRPPGGLYPAQATVVRMLMGATPLNGSIVAGGYRYQFQVGADGNALLRFSIPATAVPGTAIVTASDPQPCAATATFAVR